MNISLLSTLFVLLFSQGIKAQTAKNYKDVNWGNPISSCVFCADPTAIEHDGRLYVYGTNDQQTFNADDGKNQNDAESIRSLVVFSTNDMVNWTFHGTIDAGTVGSPWCNTSWAPSIVARKEEDGQKHFYMYFSNGVTVGVFTATSPLGPWHSPLDYNMIDWGTPGVGECAWIFDPGVVIDGDGTAWLAFGGGPANSKGTNLMPGNSRIAKLNKDMISIDQIVDLPAPYHYEANELNMMNGKYVLTYCSSWEERKDWSQYSSTIDAPSIGSMCYMVSSNPLDPRSWEYRSEYVPNEGNFDLGWGNNHTHLHKFQDSYYLFYHSTILETAMQTDASGFRSICVNKAVVDENTQHINKLELDKTGVTAIKHLNPYERQQAETMSTSGGVNYCDFKSIEKVDYNVYDNDASMNLHINMRTGSWTMLRNVDFGAKGGNEIILRAKGSGILEVRLDKIDNSPSAVIEFSSNDYADHTTTANAALLNGVHDVYLVFTEATDVWFDAWQFVESSIVPDEFETASEAVKNMKIGWNLFNTLDACADPEKDTWFKPTGWQDWETCWGQSVTKPELMKMLRKAGINVIRVPVTWYPHMDANDNVDPAWMKRVHDVVDYVIDQGMYCILNTHHDNGKWLVAEKDNYEQYHERFEKLWKQIAEEFKDYDEHLVFEGYNEITDKNWSFGSPSEELGETHAQEAYQAINDYAQSFVNAVRSTGGNNLIRNLMVNTYSACSGPIEEEWCRRPYQEMAIPNDVVQNHVIFGIHCYWMENEEHVRGFINNINECFTSRGVPTIVGEWGAYDDDNWFEDYHRYFIQQTKANNIATLYWGGLSGGPNRTYPVFNSVEEANALLKAYYGDDYEPKLLTMDDYEYVYFSQTKVSFGELWTEVSLYDKELSLDDYTGVRIEMGNTDDIHILINGDAEGKQQRCVFSSSAETFIFDRSILGKKITGIELQNMREEENETTIYNVYLIKKDGSQEKVGKEQIKSIWGCEIDNGYITRKQFVHTVDFDYLWAELYIYYDDVPLKLKNYKGIRLELEKPLNDFHVTIVGDEEQNVDYVGLNGTSTTIIFNTDIFKKEINRVTLQSDIDGKGEAKVISAWLIRQDGTEEYSDLSTFHGCEITNIQPYKPSTKGDVNNDGSVSVTDVGCTINYILEQVPLVFNFDAADMSGDKDISVTDVGMIINLILNDGAASRQKAQQNVSDAHLSLMPITGGYQIMLENKDAFVAFQMDIQLVNGATISDIRLNDNNEHQMIYRKLNNGKYRVVCYSHTNSTFTDNDVALLNISTTGDIIISDIRLTTAGLKELRPTVSNGMPTDIASVKQGIQVSVHGNKLQIISDSDTTIRLYSLGGSVCRILNVHQGVNNFDGLRAGVYMIGKRKVILK